MAPARLLSLLLLALAATRAACDGIVTTYTDLQLALASGGTWTVVSDIAMQNGTVYNGASNANATLTLVGACAAASPCVLDGGGNTSHFNVISGTLALVSLWLSNGARGTNSQDQCVTISTVYPAVFCGSTVVQPAANFSATDVVWYNNQGYGVPSHAGAGGALSLAVGLVFSFRLTGCTFEANTVTLPTGGPSGRAPQASVGGAIFISQFGLGPFTPYVSLPAGPGLGSIVNSKFIGNSATLSGGALYSYITVGNITVEGCTFSDNVAGQATAVLSSGSISGGAVYILGHSSAAYTYLLTTPFSFRAHYLFSGCNFTGNTAGILSGSGASFPFPPTQGGAIFSQYGGRGIAIINSTFTHNSAHQGGAIYFSGSSAVRLDFNAADPVLDSATSDYVTTSGGDTAGTPFVNTTGYLLSISNSSFNNNTAVGGFFAAGGALFVSCAEVVVDRVYFGGNGVPDPAPPAQPGVSAGGAILATNACIAPSALLPVVTALDVTGSRFEANYATNMGAGVALAQSARFSLIQVPSQTFNMSFSASGGAFVSNSLSSNNGLGGALFTDSSSSASFTSTDFEYNSANFGGVIYQADSSASAFSGGALTGNTAQLGGCVYLAGASTISLSSASTIFLNNSAAQGAVVYTEEALMDVVVTSSTSGILAVRNGAAFINGSANVPLNYGAGLAGVPRNFSLMAGGAPVVAPYNLSARSGAPLNLTVLVYDVYDQLVAYWNDLSVKAACVSLTSTSGTTACTATTLGGTSQAPYVQHAASLPDHYAQGLVGTVVHAALTLSSPLLAAFNPPVVLPLTITMMPCGLLQSFDASTLRCVCVAGSSLNASGSCNLCPRGTYSATTNSPICLANPAGEVSTTTTTFLSSIAFRGLSVTSFGAPEAALIKASFSAILAAEAVTVGITAASPLFSRRLLSSNTSLTFTVLTTDDAAAAAVQAALGNTTAFSSNLVAALRQSADAVLAGVTSVEAAPPTVISAYSTKPCPAGTFLNSTTLTCEACPAGSIASASQTQCFQCPPNEYASNNTCVPCPFGPDWLARSSAGSGSLLQCLCDYGHYPSPLPTANSSTFTCMQCPVGALCDSNVWLAPLALEGYWRPNSSALEFYECEPDRCEAETIETQFANCREGLDGPVCSICKPGYAMVSDNCIPCSANQAYTAWPRSRLYGFMFAVFFIVFVMTISVVLRPLFVSYGGDLMPEALRHTFQRYLTSTGRLVSVEDQAALVYLARLAAFIAVPIRLTVENLQIVSNFRKSLSIAFPGSVYSSIIKCLSLVNFNFLSLPSDACLTPRTDLFQTMHGITVSVAGLCLWFSALWFVGRLVMKLKGWPNVQIATFDRASLSRIVFVITISYAPVTEVVLAMFNCTRIGDVFYLMEDMSHQCYVGEHVKIYKEAVFWTIFYVVGVPVFYLSLLHFYGIPRVSRELRHAALLRALVDMAQRKQIPQPVVELHSLTLASISDAHINALYRGLLVQPELEEEERTPSGKLSIAHQLSNAGKFLSVPLAIVTQPLKALRRSVTLHSDGVEEISRAVKLRRLQSYSRQHLVGQTVTWHRAAGDRRLLGARQAIGSIYRDFHADAWWWILVELFNKLLLTGILPFIAKGKTAQVVAGLFLSLGLLMLYSSRPTYEEKVFRQVSLALSFIIFLFFIFMLLVKASITVIPGTNATFLGSCLAILTIAVFTLPLVLTLRRLSWPVTDSDTMREEAAEVAAEEEAAQKEELERQEISMIRSKSREMAAAAAHSAFEAAKDLVKAGHSMASGWWRDEFV